MAEIHTRSGQVTSVLPLRAALLERRTTAILKASQLEVVRVILRAGARMPTHASPGEITLQCIEGSVELDTPTDTLAMQTGDLVHLAAHEPHALRCITNASLLLTLCLVPG